MADEPRLLVYVEPEGEPNRYRGKRTRYDKETARRSSGDDARCNRRADDLSNQP